MPSGIGGSRLRTLSFGEFFAVKFDSESRKFRLQLNRSPDISRAEADAVFRHLILNQPSLSRWLIAVEEGHRFNDSPFLKSFMAEARKFTRKLIVISHQVEPFKGLGQIYEVKRLNGS